MAYLRMHGMKYHPDVVVLVYVGNDVDPMLDPNMTTWRCYPTWPPSLPELLNRLRYMSLLYQSLRLFARMKEDTGALQTSHSLTEHPRWQQSMSAVVDIANQCKIADIPFLLVHSNWSDSAFVAALEGAGIDSVSLEQAWSQVPPDRQHVSRVDPHPSTEVHFEFAKLLVSTLEDKSWI